MVGGSANDVSEAAPLLAAMGARTVTWGGGAQWRRRR